MGLVSNFYRSDAWQNFRRVLMMERRDENGVLLCAHCGKPIVRAYDCIGHHQIELTEENVNDPMVSLNPDVVDLIHFRCHNEIHERFGFGQPAKKERRVFYVWGAPLAGKTSFVRESAGADDLVVDLDAIYRAISVNELHDNSQALKINAFNVRDRLIDDIRTRTGKWNNAWVITTEALETNRARMCDKVGAEPIHVDTPRDVCVERASERPASIKYIEQYFRRLTI